MSKAQFAYHSSSKLVRFLNKPCLVSLYAFVKDVYSGKICEGETMPQGRCMKCKMQVEIKNPVNTVMKNGMEAAKGECPNCGTKVFRILGKKK